MSFDCDNIQNDIDKLDAFLKCEEASHDSDTSLDEEEVDIGGSNQKEDVRIINVNVEFNDIRPYNEQADDITSNITKVNFDIALMLNAAQQSLLIAAIQKRQKLLQTCDEQINKVQIMKQKLITKKKEKNSSCYRFGVPYFKSISLQHNCPSNSDVSDKIRNGVVALIDLPPCKLWQAHEKEILKKAVLVQSKQIRISAIKEKSENYQENIEEWKSKPLEQCVFPVSDKNVLIDWLKISIHDLKCRQNDDACKAMWYQQLHPHLNIKPYGPREAQRLKDIAAKYNFQNWDAIADELGTNRSGYHCCLFNRLNQQNENKRAHKWTPEEDAQLMSVIEKFKFGNFIPWGRIAYSFSNRDKAQIYNRYHASLRTELKKGRFTKQEDLMLLSLAKRFGDDIKKICSYFKGRSVAQMRVRYQSLVLNGNKIRRWTEEEDKKIIDFVKANYKPDQSISWTHLEKLFDNPYRTRTNIRHRWTTIKNYLNSSFEGDISAIPRPQKTRKSPLVKQTHLDNVMMILNDEKTNICNLTDITEEILSADVKRDFIDQFQNFFITKFAKIRFDQPITILETDIVNTLFLINILHGTLNLDLLYHKRFKKNCYTERNETEIIEILRQIVGKMNENSDENVLNLLKSMHHLLLPQVTTDTDPNQEQTINLILPEGFISIYQIDHMMAIIKPFLKYVMWRDSELDQFYVKKTSRFVRNLKCQFFHGSNHENTLQHYEHSIVASATTNTCAMFLDTTNARNFKAVQNREVFKVRYLALLNFKSMASIVKELIHLSQKQMTTTTEYTASSSDRNEIKGKVIKPKGRPRKMLPGGRYKHIKKDDEIKNNSAENDTSSSSNLDKSEEKLESNSIQEVLVKTETIQMDLENEADNDLCQPLLKKIKLAI